MNIDKAIIEINSNLISTLREDEKKLIHHKSIRNIIHHLIVNKSYPSSKLQELGEIRFKKKLLEYLNIVSNQKPDSYERSSQLFTEYLNPIGMFMIKHYKFSNSAGKLKIINFLIVLLFGLTSGFILSLLFNDLIYLYLGPSLLFIFILRLILKHKLKKIYGFLY